MPSHTFIPGDTVQVKRLFPPGHVRTPFYCRGKRGVVESVLGPFSNPEQLAYGAATPAALTLYRVRFLQTELWPSYKGGAEDTLDLEIYEPWLQRNEEKP